MAAYFLIWAAIIIVGTLIFYVIIKNIIKTLAIFMLIMCIFIAITATLTFSDFKEFKKDLEEKENLIVVHENGAALFATGKQGFAKNIEYNKPTIQEGEIEKWTKDGDFKAMRKEGAYNKVIVTSTAAFEPLPESMEGQDGQTTKGELIATIKSEDKTYEQKLEAFKVIEMYYKEEGIFYTVQEYKKQTTTIYPKTMFLRTVEILPESMIQKIIGQE